MQLNIYLLVGKAFLQTSELKSAGEPGENDLKHHDDFHLNNANRNFRIPDLALKYVPTRSTAVGPNYRRHFEGLSQPRSAPFLEPFCGKLLSKVDKTDGN